jgi:transposase
VVTDLHGVTGRDMMGHLIAGEASPMVLAQLARGRARRKIGELEAAPEGAEFFTKRHAALLKAILERFERLNAEIAQAHRGDRRTAGPWGNSWPRPSRCPDGAPAPPRTPSPKPART